MNSRRDQPQRSRRTAMATNTGSCALIGFLNDYNEKEPWPTRTSQVTRAGGLCSNKQVGITHGESITFLLVKAFDQLKVICHAVDAEWNGSRRFEELEECLAGKALSSFRRLVRDRYPNPADKTDANYKELCMLMPTYGSRRTKSSREQELLVRGPEAQVQELPSGCRWSRETHQRTPSHAGTPQTW